MSQPTIHECVFANHRKQDGTYNVKLRITFKRKDRKLSTNIFVTRSQLTKSFKIKDQSVLDLLEQRKREMREIISRIDPFALDAMDIDQLIAQIRKMSEAGRPFSLDFFEFSNTVIAEKPLRSGKNYASAVNALRRFLGGREKLDISEVTSSMMRGFETYLKKEFGNTARAVSLYTGAIAHIHKCARMKYNEEESELIRIKNPFEYYHPPKQSRAQHRNTTEEVLRMMMEERTQLQGRERIGVDLFLLSFGLMGMNTPDIYSLKRDIGGIVTYQRTKTRTRRSDKAEMKVRLEKEIMPIVNEYRCSFGDELFIFHNRYSSYDCLTTAINLGLRSWCKRHDIEPHLTMYSCRHTWPTVAYSIGINPAIITDALNHVDEGRRMDDIYTVKDWSVLWDANRKVLKHVFKKQ